MTTPGPVLIIGAGPGIGDALARRFGREGHPVGLLARNDDRLAVQARELDTDGIRVAWAAADILDVDALRTGITQLTDTLGEPEVVVFSPHPDVNLIKPVLDTGPADLRNSLALNVVGAAAVVGAVVPGMRAKGRGVLLFTTGSGGLNPNADRAVSGVTTTAQTVYARLLAEALAPTGVRVHHVVIVGPVGPGRRHEPAAVAEHLWQQYAGNGDTYTEIH
ncbi:SDR family NAD(P)-dependent oxidoreductase [Amycolatopsis acidicola]|uniref:SDR family NAD(P)-dependent oxidoreductase n=1 Tax=Amycolatopsis acidicola TaxID=2596893 RepID=A0A5N0UZX7_9PSEU|nr:SDR family NAD(P)-dependent oxidoreductase [Amycolatopsis acidicola]KAA9159417.1 SDR family NAD(P)-dependent oxidoreductase [Amycolatopsis acidicola]